MRAREVFLVFALLGAIQPALPQFAHGQSLPAAGQPTAPMKAAPPEDGAENDVVVTAASDAKFPEITVEFEIKRPNGSFLLDATREDIRVTEEDQPVKILGFEAPVTTERHPTTVALVVDRSLSMLQENRIGALKRAVLTFVNGLPAGSRVAVVAFGSDVEVICPFTEDIQEVTLAVTALQPMGATRFYDAVAEALELIGGESGRRVVLALTDGEDNSSRFANIDSVILGARRIGLPVHTLGLGSEDEIRSDDLRHLATETRGQYYPARDVGQLKFIYEQIAKRLSSSYTLSYRSDRPLPDGTLRPVRVYYRASKKSGETAVFVPGMVVPAGGWPKLFLLLVAFLVGLSAVPGWLTRRGNTRTI